MRRFCLKKTFLQVLHHEYLLQYSLFCASTFFHVCYVFWRTLYGVNEVVHWFLLPLATTRFTMAISLSYDYC